MCIVENGLKEKVEQVDIFLLASLRNEFIFEKKIKINAVLVDI